MKHNITLRMPERLHQQMIEDLQRPHEYAFERVGFLYTKSKWLDNKTLLIIATSYEAVAEEDYLEDDSVGAKIGANAIQKAQQTLFDQKGGCFHVHLHDHPGKPLPSGTDCDSLPGVVQSLTNISKGQATGYLILSENSFFTAIRFPEYAGLQEADLVTVVGFPMQFHYRDGKLSTTNKVFDRQSFLGAKAQGLFGRVRIGIIGYGGGGSHIGQQLAHIGVAHPCVFDGDHIEESNLNRLIGAHYKDVLQKLAKTAIAKRLIESILPSTSVILINSRWQEAPEVLQHCDLVVGCVDSYAERQQLEAECRRYLLPYVDIGMDVYQSGEDPPAMSGQVMLSLPGLPCFWCYGFLTEEKLGQEAGKYGNVGGRPQVVWPNGVLASTAVGILVELITGWTNRKDGRIYLEYDGNTGVLQPHIRLRFCGENCQHFPVQEAGPIRYREL
jgi:hypothetical protein